MFVPAFEKLLQDENIGGFQTEEYDQVRWRVFGGLLEISIAAALARCGAKSGYQLLLAYLDDIHYNFKNFALSELKSLTETGNRYGYDARAWNKYLESLTFPRQTQKVVKAVEVSYAYRLTLL